MKRMLFLSLLLGSSLIVACAHRGIPAPPKDTVHTVQSAPGVELSDYVVTVQPIVVCDDEGNDPALLRIEHDLIRGVYHRAGVQLRFMPPVFFDSTAARDGAVDVNDVVTAAQDAGVFRGFGDVSNVLFVSRINGKPGPRGLAQQPGWIVFVAMTGDQPAAQAAFELAHECGHNLGLAHAVDDDDVPDDVPNIMGDGAFEDRIKPDTLAESQIRTILASPLARKRFECLAADAARDMLAGPGTAEFFDQLQAREIAAFTQAEVVGIDADARRGEAVRRFQDSLCDFTPAESAMLCRWAKSISQRLYHDYPVFASQPWRFVKVEGYLCGGYAFTLGDCIILSDRSLDRLAEAQSDLGEHGEIPAAASLLVHEQMHVVERYCPHVFAPMFENQWGFVTGDVDPHPWVTQRQVTNPDAPSANWLVPNPDGEDGRDYLWMRTLVKGDAPVPTMGVDSVCAAIRVRRNDDGTMRIQSDSDGLPLWRLMDEYHAFIDRFPVRAGHDHPNEIAAYLFGDIFVRDYLSPGERGEAPVLADGHPMLNQFREWCLADLN